MCIRDRLQTYPWEQLVRSEQFITQAADSGIYELPVDFAYMINQTGWERSENVPLFGPLSAQAWTYLLGRDLVSYTIYASFRQAQGQFWLFPQPPAEGLDINYEYISRNWVEDSSSPGTYDDKVKAAGDKVLYEAILFERLLKTRFLEARGFDSQKALDQYVLSLDAWGARDKGAPVLNAGRGGWVYPYLDSYNNTPDTNFGTP